MLHIDDSHCYNHTYTTYNQPKLAVPDQIDWLTCTLNAALPFEPTKAVLVINDGGELSLRMAAADSARMVFLVKVWLSSLDALPCCWWQDAFPLHVVPENRFQRTATLLLYLNDVSEVRHPILQSACCLLCRLTSCRVLCMDDLRYLPQHSMRIPSCAALVRRVSKVYRT